MLGVNRSADLRDAGKPGLKPALYEPPGSPAKPAPGTSTRPLSPPTSARESPAATSASPREEAAPAIAAAPAPPVPTAAIAPPGRAWTSRELRPRAIASTADGHCAKAGRNMDPQLERGGRTRPSLNGKESPMCLEFSEWSWKLRAAELARKEREAAEAQKKQRSEPAPPAKPAAPEAPVKERETVPV